MRSAFIRVFKMFSETNKKLMIKACFVVSTSNCLTSYKLPMPAIVKSTCNYKGNNITSKGHEIPACLWTLISLKLMTFIIHVKIKVNSQLY